MMTVDAMRGYAEAAVERLREVLDTMVDSHERHEIPNTDATDFVHVVLGLVAVADDISTRILKKGRLN